MDCGLLNDRTKLDCHQWLSSLLFESSATVQIVSSNHIVRWIGHHTFSSNILLIIACIISCCIASEH
jgi:hypothetical protein